MSLTAGKRGSWSYIFIACAIIVLAIVGIRTVATPDTWMHLAAGQSISENGIPRTDTLSFSVADQSWVDSTWLYDIILYKIWNIGGAGFATLINTLLVIGAFLLMFPIAKKWAGEVAASLTIILAAWLIAPLFRVNASIATLIFPALFIAMFSRKFKSSITGISILLIAQIVWTNMNGSFLWGPVISLVFTAQNYFGTSKKDKSLAATLGFSKMLMVTGGLIVATLLNPYFLNLHKAVIASLSDPALQYTAFWISPINSAFTPDVLRHLRIVALVIGAAGLITQKDKLPLGITTLAVLSAFLVVRSLYAMALFAILSFPFLCLSMNATGEFLAEKIGGTKSSPLLTMIGRIAVVLLLIVSLGYVTTNSYYVRTGSPSSFGLGIAQTSIITPEAAEFIEKNIAADKAINTPLDGAALSYLIPGRKVFTDTRSSVYGADFYEKAVNGINGADSKNFFTTWMPDAVILNTTYGQSGYVAQNLLANHWMLVYFDGLTAIYMPNKKEFAALITDNDAKKDGIKRLNASLAAYRDSLGGTFKPALPVNLIGAANLYFANGNYKQAAGIYETLIQGAPELRTAWVNLGRCQLEQGDLENAIATLQTATETSPKDIFAWLWLGSALEKNGDEAAAADAFATANELNPKITGAFRGENEETDSEEA